MAKTDSELLAEFLSGQDRLCPGCDYNLRDLTSSQCPECGQGLLLSLRLAEPRQGALIAGLIGLASGCGMGGLMLIFAAIMTFFIRQGTNGLTSFLVINGTGFLVHGVALLLWLRYWNDIRTLSAISRRFLVIFCWTLPMVFVVVFAAVIR